MFMYKLKNTQLNDDSFTITLQSEIHNHRTRRRNDIVIPQLNKKKSQFSISYVGAKLWNSMSDELKTNQNLVSFSKNLKMMYNRYVYTCATYTLPRYIRVQILSTMLYIYIYLAIYYQMCVHLELSIISNKCSAFPVS